jgi:hypothetical protein
LTVVVGIRPPLGVEAEGGVVVGQTPQLHLGLVAAGGLADRGTPVTAQLGGGGQVSRVVDGLVPRPAAPVVGDQPPVTPHPHPLQVGGHLHPPADSGRVERVVVAVQAHVVVTRQPQRAAPPGRWRHRRQGQHRGPVGLDPVGGCAAQHPPWTLIDAAQPVAELGVEVGRGAEAAARQKRGLQVAVGPLDQALGLRITRVAEQDLGAQHPPEPMGGLGQDRLASAALADRGLPVPHQHPRHRPELGDELPPAGE